MEKMFDLDVQVTQTVTEKNVLDFSTSAYTSGFCTLSTCVVNDQN